MVAACTDDVVGLHLDEMSKMIYTASADGWINVIDAERCIVINKHELASQVTCLHADQNNRRLFVALDEGNVEIYEYTDRGSLRYLHSLCPPVASHMTRLLFDPVKNYLFGSCYDSGEIFIFEVGKRGQEKLAKQIGVIKNKPKIVDLIWKVDKMELLVCN